jgi:hypothetical protein
MAVAQFSKVSHLQFEDEKHDDKYHSQTQSDDGHADKVAEHIAFPCGVGRFQPPCHRTLLQRALRAGP